MAVLYLLNHTYICSLGWLIVRTSTAKGVEGKVPLYIRFFSGKNGGIITDNFKLFSIPVFRSAVLVAGLEVVMPLAEALPV